MNALTNLLTNVYLVLGIWDAAMNKTNKDPILLELTF